MSHKFHGIKLAGGSYIENAAVERVAGNPSNLEAGRTWFNMLTSTFNYSDLDGLGAVRINSFGSLAAMNTAIDAVNTAITNEVNARTAAVAAEVARAQAAEGVLTTDLAAEVVARTSGDSTEATARVAGDTTEAAARTAAIAVAAATAADATSTEAAARLAGDAAANTRIDGAWAELDATQAGAGLNTDGTFTAPLNTTYLGTVTTLKAADVALDTALAAEVTARTAADVSIGSALANEAQLRADGDTNLQTQITAWVNVQIAANASADLVEQAARIAADSALQAELDRTQATVGTDANGNLIPIVGTHYLDAVTTVFGGAFVLDQQVYNANTAIAAEVSARQAADVVLDAALSTEIVARTTADTAIQAELNTTQTGAGLETSGAYLAPTGSNYLDLAVSLKDADAILDAAAMAISNRVTAVETVTIPGLQSQITAEVARATGAESAEATARAAADTTLGTAISTETTRAQGVEATLAASVTAEQGRAVLAENSLQSQVDAIVAASGSGAAALKTELNATRYTFMSVAPALVHTVVHNMNTHFYSADIMVQGIDGIWRNDIMPVEDVDLNSYTITLTEASMVKASGQSNAALA